VRKVQICEFVQKVQICEIVQKVQKKRKLQLPMSPIRAKSSDLRNRAKSPDLRKLQLPMLVLVLGTAVACPLALLCTLSCSSLSGSQPLACAATNAFPKVVASIDGLKVVADSTGNSTVEAIAGLIASVAIGGIGMWAKLTHGQVAQNTATLAAMAPAATTARSDSSSGIAPASQGTPSTTTVVLQNTPENIAAARALLFPKHPGTPATPQTSI
jgi:hypothetical protein